MIVDAKSPALLSLIDPAEQLRPLGGGFQFTEGPVWHPGEQALYFSDIPSDARWRWTQAAGIELAAKPTFKANGLVFDRQRNLLACEQVTSTVTRFHPDGSRELVAFHTGGTYLNSPNDIVVRGRDGSIYFSDPDYGRWNDWIGCKREFPLGYRSVMRVPEHGGGEAFPVTPPDEFDQPNGLCFSPDESVLYVNDSAKARIKAFDVADDGSLSNARILIENVGSGFVESDAEDRAASHKKLHDAGALDGMKCDELGNVWTTGPGGIWVISPAGEHLGVLRTPEVAGNLVWGGDDLKSLFVMTSTTLHVVRTLAASAPLAHH